jgi:hypothetical protein
VAQLRFGAAQGATQVVNLPDVEALAGFFVRCGT